MSSPHKMKFTESGGISNDALARDLHFPGTEEEPSSSNTTIPSDSGVSASTIARAEDQFPTQDIQLSSPNTIATTTTKNPSNTIKWADQAVISPSTNDNIFPIDLDKQAQKLGTNIENKTASLTTHVTSGATKLVGWTYDNVNLETQTKSKKLRPMHVRVSVRVHHVAFLHPGLDNGGRATIANRNQNTSSRWKFGKKKKVSSSPPGLMHFGSKKGDWKNPLSPKVKPFAGLGGKKDNGGDNVRTGVDNDDSEVQEIIAAEAFRLSRDGIIQHHYALNRTVPSSQTDQRPSSPTTYGRRSTFSPAQRFSNSPTSLRRPGPLKQDTSNSRQGNNSPRDVTNMLSPYSSSNPEEVARYYKECADRPKGYRRLVVSSAVPTNDVQIPSPPSSMPDYTNVSSGKLSTTQKSSRLKHRDNPHSFETSSAETLQNESSRSWDFTKHDDFATDERNGHDKKKRDDKKEHLFDNIEYQYVGPKQTGPAFFDLLRRHGAANYGRYLPELACNVPDHSIGFEIRKSMSKRRCASTQPLVCEAPHIIWGDARDKMLSKIAKEGCPLIDSRQFEYVSNADLEDTELTESLMCIGATLWVQNADEEGSAPSKLKPQYTKGMVEAEYYGGRFADGMEVGIKGMAKGITKVSKGTYNATKKGTKEVMKGTKGLLEDGNKLVPIPHDKELITTQVSPSKERRTRKRDKVKNLFKGGKFRRRSRKKDDDGNSIDGSVASSIGNDDQSIGSESIVTESSRLEVDQDDAHTRDVNVSVDGSLKEEEFIVVKPVPYVLLLDDGIDIRIVSFPDNDDVIANFPISVASVMVQRTMEDRVQDPLKPSELTATLIQEPCAQTMKWGVELKVTLRAVEVKPNIPRVMPRPKDMIDEEMKHLKEKLKLMGKKSEEVKKTLKEKEDEVMKEEHDLDGAIVSYGYGRGEDGGAGLNEIRLRQMFYSADEHSDITRKIKRRKSLTEIEKAFMADARIDPCATIKRKKGKAEEQKLLHQLNINFPGIEDDSVNERTSSIEGMDVVTTTRSESDFSTLDESPIVKASLSMAKSLDLCFHPARSTVSKVEQQMRHTITEGMKSKYCSSSEYKRWCLEMGDELATIARSESNSDETIKSTVAKMQSVIAKSVTLRPGMSLDVDVEESEESKGDEDKSTDLPVEHSELVEWVAAVTSQLEGSALELDDDAESTAHDDDKSFNQSVGKAAGDKASKLKEGEETKGSARPSPLTISPRRRDGSDQDVWDKVLSSPKKGLDASSSPSSNSRRRLKSSSSVSSIRDALPSKPKSKKTKVYTSSSFTTLVYFIFVAAMSVVGAVVIFELYQSYWLSTIEVK